MRAQLPPRRVPFLEADGRTVTKAWWDWFSAIDENIGDVAWALTDDTTLTAVATKPDGSTKTGTVTVA